MNKITIEPIKLPKDIKLYPTIEEFNKNLPETVDLLQTEEGNNVYVIGTVHFSLKSQDDVSAVIRNVRPDVLVLELCPLRLHILYYDEERLLKEVAELNFQKIAHIFKQHSVTGGIFYLKFLRVNADIAKQLGIAPGGECRRAIAEAMQLGNCQVILADRLISVTFERAIRELSRTDRLKLYFSFVFKGRNEKITVDDVENIKKRQPTDKSLKVRDQYVQAIYKSFITERDILLCHSLQHAALNRADFNGLTRPINVVGVVGVGHLQGIRDNWTKSFKSDEIQKLLTILPEPISNAIGKQILRFGMIAFGSYGIYKIAFAKDSKE